MEKRQNLGGPKKGKTRKADPDMVYGKRAIEEVFAADKRLEKLFLQKDLKGPFAENIKQLAKSSKTPLSLVPVEKLNRITRRNHQGVIGFLSLIEYSSLHHVISRCFDEGKDPLVLILDEITDVRNLGSIARSAECAGVDAIVLPTRGSAQINSDAMKTSAGALNHVPVCKEANLFEACRYLQNSGLRILACTEKGEGHYYEQDLTVPTALIMGSEDTGITNQLLKASDALVKIPMLGKVSSLNVANAASVILFEVVRQRMAG